MRKPETVLVNKIISALEKEFGGYWKNIHGSVFQARGIPDIIGCCGGRYFGIEVKCPGKTNELTKYQEYNLMLIAKAGGFSQCVETVNDAISFVGSSMKGVENVKIKIKRSLLKAAPVVEAPSKKKSKSLSVKQPIVIKESEESTFDRVYRELQTSIKNKVYGQSKRVIEAKVERHVTQQPKEKKILKSKAENSQIETITAKELANELGVEPIMLRRYLRSKFVQPQGRWEWDSDDSDLAKIREHFSK